MRWLFSIFRSFKGHIYHNLYISYFYGSVPVAPPTSSKLLQAHPCVPVAPPSSSKLLPRSPQSSSNLIRNERRFFGEGSGTHKWRSSYKQDIFLICVACVQGGKSRGYISAVFFFIIDLCYLLWESYKVYLNNVAEMFTFGVGNSAPRLLLSQGAEWKIQTESQHKEWKIWPKRSYFGVPKFAKR